MHRKKQYKKIINDLGLISPVVIQKFNCDLSSDTSCVDHGAWFTGHPWDYRMGLLATLKKINIYQGCQSKSICLITL